MTAPAAHPTHPHVFEPILVGGVEIKNRIFVSPHGIAHFARDPENPGFALPSPGATDYFVARARGGVGLILQGGTMVHPTSMYTGTLCYQLFSDLAVEAFAPMVEAVHEHGTKMFAQLWHAGHHADRLGRYGGPLSASAVQPVESPALPVRAMSKDDIREIVASFGTCTANARRAGYDGVELHATHAYLPEQFLSPFFNQRTDEYGGSLDNRMRFTLEALEAMREAAGPMAVGIRLMCEEPFPGGLTSEDCREIASILDESGLVDFFDLDIGTYHDFDVLIAPWQVPEHFQLPAIAEVSSVITRAVRMGVPTRFHDPAAAEEWIADGVLDMVGGTRGFLADPELVVKAETGRSAEIRPCIGMNTCMTPHGCAVNPTSGHGVEGRPRRATIEVAETARRVVIVGGGPAGLEAARVAALRGHSVQLFDAQPVLGGALNLVAAIPGRDTVLHAVEWWSRELDRLGVAVTLKTEVNRDLVASEGADIVLVATGARFDTSGSTGFRTRLAGADQAHVFTPEQILEGDDQLSGTFVVLDEEAATAGIGVAEALAARGADVEVITRWAQPAQFLSQDFPNWYSHARRRLHAAGVRFSTHSYIETIGADHVVIFDVDTGEIRRIENVSGVVLVTLRRPFRALADELHGAAAEVHVIGDAHAPSNMARAVRQSWDLVRTL